MPEDFQADPDAIFQELLKCMLDSELEMDTSVEGPASAGSDGVDG